MAQMSKTLVAAFNRQINKELSSAYTYLNMSVKCEAANFQGTAHWLRLQWQEELLHAQKLIDFVLGRNSLVELLAIEAPRFDFENLPGVFERVLSEERKVTESIHGLYELATQERDFSSHPLLQWFMTEQIEEEASAQEIIDRLKIVGNEGMALLILDGKLGERPAASQSAAPSPAN